MNVKVLLNSVEKVKNFVNITNEADFDIDLLSGKNTYLDAKSLLGILSCDCREPMELSMVAGETQKEEFIRKISNYIVA